MTKSEQFLWCVQTALLNNQLQLSRQMETKVLSKHLGIEHIHLVTARALWAASMLPESLSASEASLEFCKYAFDNLWEEGQSRPEWLVGIPV